MGFFSNLNMVQESDREQAAVFQAEMPEPKNQPVQAVPSTDTADGMTAAPPSAEASKPAEKEKTQPEQAEEEKRKAHEEAEANGKPSGKKTSASARKRNGSNGKRRLPWTTTR